MSSEREKNAVNALVTETYRDLASEKTPEHLNRAVLKKAVLKQTSSKMRAAKEPLSARWMRPLTWAATIGLSLAIVLEVSKLPSITDADMAMPESVIAEPRPIRDEFENAAVEAREVIESRARLAASPIREAEDDPSAAPKKSADNPLLETVGLEKISPKHKQESFAAGASRINSVSRSAAVEQSSDELLAEPQPELLEESLLDSTAAAKITEPAVPDTALAYTRAVAEAEAKPESACTESTRESADEWLQCIADLRLAGREETANSESVLFVIQFPAEAARLEANK